MTGAEPASRRRSRCALCGSRDLATVLSLAPSPPGNGLVREGASPQACFPLDLGRCGACGHVQLLDIIDRITMLGRPAAADRASPHRLAATKTFARTLAERLRPARDALIVDIGSNDGSFLKVFEAIGLRVHGIEPAPNLAGDAIRDGVPTHAGLFSPAIAERIEEARGRAEIVVAHQALAEAEDPFAVLEGVRALLRRDGVFAFCLDALAAVVAHDRLEGIDHRSLGYHTVAPLKRFLSACDMELFALVPASRERICGLAQRLGGPHDADGSVEHAAAAEAAGGLADGSALAPFAARIGRLIAATAAGLGSARAAGAGIAALGAGCGATTWLSQLGPAAAAIAFLADDAPERQALFSPVLGLPIRPLEALAAERPDLVIVLDGEAEEDVRDRFGGLIAAGMRLETPARLAALGAS